MKCKTIRKVLPLLLASSMLVNMCSSVAYADSDTIINGTIKASTIDISASGTATYTIDEKTLISDTLQVLNNANFPVSIAVADVTKTSGTIEDVLPSAVGTQDDWFNLGRKDSESKIALGLKHTGGDYLEEFTSDTVYFKNIQDSTDPISLGAIAANTNAEYEIDGFHGLAFSSEISEQYKITWDIGLYDGSGSSGGSSGSESGDVNTYSVDREEDTALTYDLTNNDTASAASMFSLDDLFGVHTVKAAPIDVPQDEVTNIVGEATITGLKDTSISELYIADYYQDENGDYYKITGIAEGTEDDPTIESDSLTKIVIPDGITEISKYAFYGNTTLEEIVLPNTLKSIYAAAFSDCTNLKRVNSDVDGVCNLPDGLELLDTRCFFENRKLSTYYVPSSVNKINFNVFSNRGTNAVTYNGIYLEANSIDELPTFTLDENDNMRSSEETLTYYYFLNNSNNAYFTVTNTELANAIIDSTDASFPVKSSDTDVLYKFSSTDTEATLESVLITSNDISVYEIPSTYNGKPVTTIADKLTFNLKMSSGTIVLPETITTIGKEAFKNCYMIKVPSSVETIGTNAFQYAEYVVYDGSLSTSEWNAENVIGSEAIDENFIYADNEKTIISNFIGSATNVTVPEGVTTIKTEAFASSNVEYVTLPSTLTTIEYKAFQRATALKEIEIPESVTTLNTYTFFGCTNLEKVTLPSTLSTISDYCFQECAALTEIKIPDSVTTLGKSVFQGCTSLTEIEIPSTVKTIGSYTFTNCTNLTTIYYNGTATGAPWGATNATVDNTGFSDENFTYTTREKTTIVKYIGTSTEVVIPEGITSIPASLFSGKTNITKVTLPSTLTAIPHHCFYGCSSLSDVNIPSSVTTIGDYAFYNCKALTDIEIPSSVTTIGEEAFKNCSALENLTLNEGLTIIKASAFDYCSKLLEITVPDSVTTIGSNAFDCNALTVVYYNGTATGAPWGAYKVETY